MLFGNATLATAVQRTVGGGEGRQGDHYTWGLERPWSAQAVAQLRSGRSSITGPCSGGDCRSLCLFLSFISQS